MPETLPPPSASAAAADPPRPPEGRPRLLHVRCPQGHRLEAPCTLDGQDVVCPYCSERFPFSYENSDEFEADRQRVPEADERTHSTGRATWREWALIALIMASLGVVVHQAFSHWM